MTPLQSPEHAALVAAKEARDTAMANTTYFERKFLAYARHDSNFDVDNERYSWIEAANAADAAGETLEAAQAAFDAAYPAPTEVVDAVTAAQAARAELVRIGNELADSYTPAQLDLMNARDDAQTALDAAVTVAKALIEAAQVSPSKAFVVRKSVKAAVSVKADRPYIFEAARGGVLPVSLLTLDESALVKWIEDNSDAALDYGASVTRTENTAVSVAFYVAKL